MSTGISSLRTIGVFLRKGTCSQTLAVVLDQSYGHPLLHEELASDPLAGGILQHGCQCGQVWGATLAAGAEAYRRFGATPKAESCAVMAAQVVMDSFRTQNHSCDCFDITGLNKDSSVGQMVKFFLLKGGAVGCFLRAARYAPVAREHIDRALEEPTPDLPADSPVGCAALTARKAGSTDMHQVMAAGMAGGIGLSGGGCGALGAALWLEGIRRIEQDEWKGDMKPAWAQDMIDQFLTLTRGELRCEKIVGRKFSDVDDHARYVCNGGCEAIVEALAARLRLSAG